METIWWSRSVSLWSIVSSSTLVVPIMAPARPGWNAPVAIAPAWLSFIPA